MYARVVQGLRRTPPPPIQIGHSHHDGRAGGYVPSRPIAGTSNPRGGAAVSSRGLNPGGGGYRLGGAQASPEPLMQPIGGEIGTPLLVADFCDLGQHT